MFSVGARTVVRAGLREAGDRSRPYRPQLARLVPWVRTQSSCEMEEVKLVKSSGLPKGVSFGISAEIDDATSEVAETFRQILHFGRKSNFGPKVKYPQLFLANNFY